MKEIRSDLELGTTLATILKYYREMSLIKCNVRRVSRLMVGTRTISPRDCSLLRRNSHLEKWQVAGFYLSRLSTHSAEVKLTKKYMYV